MECFKQALGSKGDERVGMALRRHDPEQCTEHERAAIALNHDSANVLPWKCNGVVEARYKADLVGTDDHSAPWWWGVRWRSNQRSLVNGLHEAIMTLMLGQFLHKRLRFTHRYKTPATSRPSTSAAR